MYADNDELFPISLSLHLDLSNLSFSKGDKTVFVIPSRKARFIIGELTALDNGATNFKYTYKTTIGDVTQKTYDESYIYDLPFQKGKTYYLYQGYNGNFSHQNKNALDFTMPEGTPIVAARDGIVVGVVQNHTESCLEEGCEKYNNYIMVMHSDKTFAYYGHIKHNGANCKLADSVKKGDVIAYSGNVGRTSGPHLHFECFIGGFETNLTLETKFKIDNGDKVEMLKQGTKYLRNY